MQRKLILASRSPYRKMLLQKLGLAFETIAADIDETPAPNERPDVLVARLALTKARVIAQRHPGSLVIGSDQVAVHGNNIVGKPKNHADAVKQLRTASGKTVSLYTGLALINADSNQTQTEVIPFYITFRTLSDAQIENYLRKDQPYDCAGSVKSEGLGIALLEKFDGEDPNTLIGLPLIRLIKMLENEGVNVV